MGWRHNSSAFALPSVLIASVVMLMVLVAAVTSVGVSRTALTAAYYDALAREAAESGMAMAMACLDRNSLTPTWTDGAPLRSNTNCQGVEQVSCPSTVRNARCGVIDSPTLRTTFRVDAPLDSGPERKLVATGVVQLLRRSNSQVWRTYTYTGQQAIIQVQDPTTARAVQRYWIFGDRSGLDFGVDGNSVTTFTQPCAASPCRANEGSTVVTDRGGNLLFWTDGRTVWTRTGTVMQNSAGLMANASTTQASAFFPLDRTQTRYGVVTNNAEHAAINAGQLYYSIIDMTLDGGRGAVTAQKNIPLWPEMSGYTSEALTAAPKADGTGFWVLTFRPGTTNLLVFEFDTNGLVAGSRREYPTGTSISKFNANIGYGTLNFTNDYTKLLLLASNHCEGTAACANETGIIRILNFDSSTGTPSGGLTWSNGTSARVTTSPMTNRGYSADFSPDERYVYATTLYPGRLYRYKIEGATSGSAIKATEEYIGMTNSATDPNVYNGSGQVRRAPDGRMYIANYGATAISVINNPNADTTASMTTAQRQAAVGFIYNGRSLASGTTSAYGLPQLVTTYEPKIIVY